MRYVLLYSRENCMQCKMVKRWLQEHDIAFKECDLTHDEIEAKHLQMLGFKTIPLLYVDTDVFNGFINGFDIKKLNEVFPGGN